MDQPTLLRERLTLASALYRRFRNQSETAYNRARHGQTQKGCGPARQDEREAERDIDLCSTAATAGRRPTFTHIATWAVRHSFRATIFRGFPSAPCLQSGGETEVVDRPRFLGLSEFGPNNIVYHEGRRHYVTGLILGAPGLEARMVTPGCALAAALSIATARYNSHCSYCAVELSAIRRSQPSFTPWRWCGPAARANHLRRRRAEAGRLRNQYPLQDHTRDSSAPLPP